MALVPTGFRLTTRDIKWALVTVAAADGTIDREYEITAQEAAAVQQSPTAGPPGCSKEEWQTGRVSVTTRPLRPGLARVLPDGTMVLNHGIQKRLKKVMVDTLRIPASDFEVRGGVVWLDAELAKRVDRPSWQ